MSKDMVMGKRATMCWAALTGLIGARTAHRKRPARSRFTACVSSSVKGECQDWVAPPLAGASPSTL
ncbi:hypothetical protein GobsT_52440 [Gemmata obscuriglobus]|nr:hypothetical protein GobsT_52440 [Gemmata obscuriglobus]VTS09763.1 unnamed protein product [Gemmata obscuriglobus UQM 2246]